jgi:hypothetical protein
MNNEVKYTKKQRMSIHWVSPVGVFPNQFKQFLATGYHEIIFIICTNLYTNVLMNKY